LPTGRARSVFIAGFIAGAVALAFNFLLRLGSLAAFPPESALSAFLSIVPASIEEPMVQRFGDLAGQLGLLVATAIAALVYGALAVIYDKYVSARINRISPFEGLLVFSFVPWLLFGLILFPVDGNSLFGTASGFAPASATMLFPFVFLLVQAVFALALSPRYAPSASPQSRPDASRRGFIEKSAIGLLAVVAGIMSLGGLGSVFSSQIQPTGGSQPVDLQGAPPIFSDPRLQTLVDSEVTPNGSFYRVAIDIIDPTVDASGWSLSVNGLVGSPKTYTYAQVQTLPQTTLYNTFECVSNQIDGNLISTAKWTGVKLSDLLQDVGGTQSGASYLVFYSVDGYSVGVPLAKALMPDSIIAFLMNDQPLPTSHGYPLRAVIPGLYGMMSAKWIKQISILDSTYSGYWQTRGWSNVGTVNPVTFITTPQSGSQLSLKASDASIIIAGYAYGGDKGVSRVEVSFDDGKTWQQAQLKNPLSSTTWVLWAYEWQPTQVGETFVYARVTDGSGQVQTSTIADTFPNGATGYAYVDFHLVS
jgi:DMSO/TMAO reductase YedYZ molybdopterin-dependent catalytic subunit